MVSVRAETIGNWAATGTRLSQERPPSWLPFRHVLTCVCSPVICYFSCLMFAEIRAHVYMSTPRHLSPQCEIKKQKQK